MAYNNAIPQATDRIADSQAPILANFAAIDTVVSINHVTFDDSSGDQGKHKWVSMPEQAAAPATLANELAVFSQESSLTSVAELAFRRESSGDVVEFSSGKADEPGWAIFPSGILVKWGKSGAASGLTTITYSVSADIPVFATVFHAQVTPFSSSTSDINIATRLVDFNTTQIRTLNTNRTTTGSASTPFQVRYLVIGTAA